MLSCGANLERVNITMESIAHHYGIHDLGIHSLSTMISISALGEEGRNVSKVTRVPPLILNMEKLRLITVLVKKVNKEKPEPELLDSMLEDTLAGVKSHKESTRFIGFLIAIAALTRLFGGLWQDEIVAIVNTALLFFLSKMFTKLRINHILTNFIELYIVGMITGLLTWAGFVQNFYVVILANAFFLIPGIPLVNSVRSIICGNELNGLLELFKVILESLSIVAGAAASYFIFSSCIGNLEDAFPPGDYSNLLYDAEIIVLSFLCSFGFGLTFHISWKEIGYAGIGAMLVRTVYILCLYFIPGYRFLIMLLAAFSADVFSESIAKIKHCPATYYLYAFVIPLIPGDLAAYSMFGVVWQNGTLFMENIIPLLESLLGISVGFVLASSIMHYVRKIKLGRMFAHNIKR